jgi:hypothetical protein
MVNFGSPCFVEFTRFYGQSVRYLIRIRSQIFFMRCHAITKIKFRVDTGTGTTGRKFATRRQSGFRGPPQ